MTQIFNGRFTAQFESGYGNMPSFGLAAAMEHVPTIGRRETTRKRLEVNPSNGPILGTEKRQ